MKKLFLIIVALVFIFGIFAVSGYANDYRERWKECKDDLEETQTDLESLYIVLGNCDDALERALVENAILTEQIDVLTDKNNELYAQLAVKDESIEELQGKYNDALADYVNCEDSLTDYQKNWFFGGAFSIPIGGSAFAGYMFDDQPYGLLGQAGYMKRHGYINLGFFLRY